MVSLFSKSLFLRFMFSDSLFRISGPLKFELKFRCWYGGFVTANGLRAFRDSSRNMKFMLP